MSRFVRFPGGCYVEGDRLANRFQWKNAIGLAEERPGHSNLWGYRSTDGAPRLFQYMTGGAALPCRVHTAAGAPVS